MYSFRRISLDSFERDPIRSSLPEMTVFQTPCWFRFLLETQGGDPVIALVNDSAGPVGYFTGMLVTKFGLRILGSPFPGWSTGYMGFNLAPGVRHFDVLRDFTAWAFEELHCVHLEMMDRHIAQGDVQQAGFSYIQESGFEIDLARSEDELFRRMSHPCRNNLRKAQKNGLIVEQCTDLTFAGDYYRQLIQVFGKRDLVPTYSIDRVKALIRHVGQAGNAVFLRARMPDGKCIATTIMVGNKNQAYLWGAASYREYQILRPNELLYWSMICRAREAGMRCLDMGGGGEYKRKYGGTPICVPWFYVSSNAFIPKLRRVAQSAIDLKQRLLGRFKKKPQAPATADREDDVLTTAA